MKKNLLLFFALIIFAIQGYSQMNFASAIIGAKLHFSVQWSGPVGGATPIPRTPISTPTVYMDGHTLYFEADHPAFTLVLLDEDGEEVYTVTVPTTVEEITLPSDLIGDYELQLYDGSNFYFYCDIVL